jgi:5-methylcytosine-specific restriction enzyme A
VSRSTKEWIGKTDDTPIPDRVKLRVFLRHNGKCQCGCGRKIISGQAWQCDHRIALINGGSHRENNLVPLLLECHKNKTKADVAEKSVTYHKRKAHLGIAKSKYPPIMGSKRSGWKRKMDGSWVRR